MNHVMQDSQQEIESILGNVSFNRATLYQLVSMAIQFPTYELAENLLNGTFYSEIEKSIQWVNARDGMYNTSLEKLKRVAENEIGLHPEELLKKMEEEYTRLFLIPDQVVVSPFESDNSDATKDSIIDSLEKVYREVGAIAFSDYLLPIDHITAELDFLSYLCQQEAVSWKMGEMLEAKKWKVKQRTFIVHHLRKWGISFFVKVERSTELEAYRAIASVGKIFMTLEHGN